MITSTTDSLNSIYANTTLDFHSEAISLQISELRKRASDITDLLQNLQTEITEEDRVYQNKNLELQDSKLRNSILSERLTETAELDFDNFLEVFDQNSTIEQLADEVKLLKLHTDSKRKRYSELSTEKINIETTLNNSDQSSQIGLFQSSLDFIEQFNTEHADIHNRDSKKQAIIHNRNSEEQAIIRNALENGQIAMLDKTVATTSSADDKFNDRKPKIVRWMQQNLTFVEMAHFLEISVKGVSLYCQRHRRELEEASGLELHGERVRRIDPSDGRIKYYIMRKPYNPMRKPYDSSVDDLSD